MFDFEGCLFWQESKEKTGRLIHNRLGRREHQQQHEPIEPVVQLC